MRLEVARKNYKHKLILCQASIKKMTSKSIIFSHQMNEMTAWEVVVVEQTSSGESSLSFSSLAQAPSRYDELIVQDLSNIGNIFPEGHVFFSAHDIYLGNSISSYGGFFRYSLLFVRGDNGEFI